jgi:hypothetical protein
MLAEAALAGLVAKMAGAAADPASMLLREIFMTPPVTTSNWTRIVQ